MLAYTREEIESGIARGEVVHVSSESEITLSSPIQIDYRTTIIGGRFYTPAGTPAFDLRSSGITLERPEIRGRGHANGRGSSDRLILCNGSATAPFYDINIRHAKLIDSSSDNIYFRYVRDSEITSNRIRNFLYSGVMLLSCDGVRVTGNTISDSPLSSGVVNTYGIAASDSENTVAARSRNIVISDNIVENIQWEGIDTHGGCHITVTGNIVKNCVRGIALVVGNDTRETVPTDCVVTGNMIDGMGSSREGISLYGKAGGARADAVITGNKVMGHATPIYANNYDRAKTYIGGNNVPHISWKDLPMENGWTANSVYKPQYMVDGDMVYLRGMVIPPSPFSTTFGNVTSAYAPSILSMVRHTKGTNPVAGDATIGVSTSGLLSMYYSTISDRYSYPIDSQYRMI